MPRRRTPWACALLLAVLATGCGDGTTSEADGKRAAQETRERVGGKYWDLYGSVDLAGQKWSSAHGHFLGCGKNTVRYEVEANFSGKDATTTDEAFAAPFLTGAREAGWKLKPDGKRTYRGTAGGVTMSLRLFERDQDGGAPGGQIRLLGACVDVGRAESAVTDPYGGGHTDSYRPEDAPAVPTGYPTP